MPRSELKNDKSRIVKTRRYFTVFFILKMDFRKIKCMLQSSNVRKF